MKKQNRGRDTATALNVQGCIRTLVSLRLPRHKSVSLHRITFKLEMTINHVVICDLKTIFCMTRCTVVFKIYFRCSFNKLWTASTSIINCSILYGILPFNYLVKVLKSKALKVRALSWYGSILWKQKIFIQNFNVIQTLIISYKIKRNIFL